MIPFILAALGGYLIADSMKSQSFDDGGDIDDDDDDDIKINEESLLEQAFEQDADIDMYGNEITAKWKYKIDGHEVFIKSKFGYDADADEDGVTYYFSGYIDAEIDNEDVEVPEELYDKIRDYLKEELKEASWDDDDFADGGVIMSARITDMPKNYFDEMPKVYVTYQDGTEEFLFDYYPDEISFKPEEFKGLTKEQAKHLKFQKDRDYLMYSNQHAFEKGGDIKYQIVSPKGYYSRSMQSGKPVFLQSFEMGYTFLKEDAEKQLEALQRELGVDNLKILPFGKEIMAKGGETRKKFKVNFELDRNKIGSLMILADSKEDAKSIFEKYLGFARIVSVKEEKSSKNYTALV